MGGFKEVPQPWASGADWPCFHGVSCTTELWAFETAAKYPVCQDCCLYTVLSNPHINPQVGLQENRARTRAAPPVFSRAFILCSLSLNNKLDAVTLFWWVAPSSLCKGLGRAGTGPSYLAPSDHSTHREAWLLPPLPPLHPPTKVFIINDYHTRGQWQWCAWQARGRGGGIPYSVFYSCQAQRLCTLVPILQKERRKVLLLGESQTARSLIPDSQLQTVGSPNPQELCSPGFSDLEWPFLCWRSV